MKIITKLILIQFFVTSLLSALLLFLTPLSLRKALIVIGVFYIVYGTFELINLIEQGQMTNMFIRYKNLSRIDSINLTDSNSIGNEYFLIYILWGFLVISII